MKKVLIIILTTLVAGFMSCSKDDGSPKKELEYGMFTFFSMKPGWDYDGTKTEWTGETILWSKNDQIRMAYTVAGTWQGASDVSTTPKLYASDRLAEATQIAKFKVSDNFTSTASGTHVFYALYPGSLVSSTDFSNAPQASINIPIEQTPASDSFDPAADVMVGISEQFSEKPSEEILLSWKRLVAHAILTINNLSIKSGETIQSIKLKAQDGADLVGAHSLNIMNSTISSPRGTTNEIVLNADNLTYSSNSIKVWASMLPATITELTVTIETDKAFYTRSFIGITREFKRNKRNTMTIGMSSATRTEKNLNLQDFEESFSESLGDFTIEKQTLSEALTYVWSVDTEHKYAKGSAYAGGAKQAVSYLISPELTIGSNNSKVSFQHTANYIGAGNFNKYFSVVLFEGSKEHVLTLDVVPTGNNWTFVTSTVDLSAYKGKAVRIGFKYTSTSSTAGTWEIKSFKVTDVIKGQGAEFGWLELPAAKTGSDFFNGTFYKDNEVSGENRNYSYMYQYSTYTSMWTAYPLYAATMRSGEIVPGPYTPMEMASGADRGTNWAANPDIIDKTLQVNVWDGGYGVSVANPPYVSDTYARGHQIPNADRSNIVSMQTQTYYATNSTPQIQNRFNGYIWVDLENAVRACIKDTVYVVTGPVFRKKGGSESITYITPQHDTGKSVPVANYYWKVLLKVKRNSSGTITSASAIGFWFEHRQYDKAERDFTQHATSVNQIEAWTGFDFFTNLPEELQATAEANTNWTTFKNF